MAGYGHAALAGAESGEMALAELDRTARETLAVEAKGSLRVLRSAYIQSLTHTIA